MVGNIVGNILSFFLSFFWLTMKDTVVHVGFLPGKTVFEVPPLDLLFLVGGATALVRIDS